MAGHQTIVIVGNGPVPPDAAPQIAGAGLVVRFNDCRSFRPGERSDVVAVCNTGRPAKAMLETQDWARHPAVAGASAIWCVRDPVLFSGLRAPLAVSHPDLDDFCDDETQGFADFSARAGKAFRVVDGDIHTAVDAGLLTFRPKPYVVPSSGMIVIAEVMASRPGAEIVLAGFGHEGWEGHPFAAERQMVDCWAAEGRLRRLDASAVPLRAAGDGRTRWARR